ncbi:MAG: hypothetical protein ACKO2N_02440, partial [Tabrizicola sp.]
HPRRRADRTRQPRRPGRNLDPRRPCRPDAPRVDLTRLATTETNRATTPDPMTAWLETRLDPDATSRGFTLKPAPLTLIRQIIRLTPMEP